MWLSGFLLHAQQQPAAPSAPAKPLPGSSTPQAAEGDENAPAASVPADSVSAASANVNLLGQANTERGEGRRNENVQINLVDNNAQRDVNQRVGATATIVEEFRPERGYFAGEFGIPSKGPIHASPQTGTGFHGNIFWNHNNSIFSARTFFQVGTVQPARQNQYGAAFTTKVWRNAFFSFNGSQDKNRGMVNGNVIIPLQDERTPLTDDPILRPYVENIISAFPNVAPNRPDISSRALNANSPQSTNTDLASGQLNQKMGARDSLLFRYTYTGQQVKAFQFVRGQNPDTTNKSHASRITWDRAWSPTTVSDFSFGFDRQGTLLVPAEGAVGPIFFAGLTQLGPITNVPLNRAQNQWLTSFSLQQRRGAHQWSAGATLTRRQFNGDESEGSRLIQQFRNDFGHDVITNLRLGTPSFIQQAFGDTYRAFRSWDLAAFVGDKWTVTNRFTLNFGLRYEPTTVPIDRTGKTVLPYDSDWNNVGGSFGFAYRLPGGWGVLRGAGAGLFGQIFPGTFSGERQNPPYYARVNVNAPDMRDPFAGIDTSNLVNARSIQTRVSPDLATPYSYQYNFSWEAELHPGWRLQLGYVGSRSHKLFQSYNLNRAGVVPGIPTTIDTINLRRADPTAFEVYWINNGSNAYYDAARVNFTMPNWHGITLNAAYWFSKAIDLGGDYNNIGAGPEKIGSGGQTELNVHGDLKALSNFDQPHALLLQAAYNTGRSHSGWFGTLFRNWDLASVYLLKSGTPFTIESGSDGPGFGNVDGLLGDRVFVVDPSQLGHTVGNPDLAPLLLPRSAFRFMNVAAGETAGDLGKNTFRKGKITNLNASLARTWTLPHDLQMTFRAESINFTNTPQFAEPGRQLASPNFGQITNTLNDGRTFRFLLRFAF